MQTPQSGTIRSLNPDKGFGFVSPQSGGPDVFFHRSACPLDLRTLRVGQEVKFSLGGNDPARPRASEVVVRGGQPPRRDAGAGRAGRPPRREGGDRQPTAGRSSPAGGPRRAPRDGDGRPRTDRARTARPGGEGAGHTRRRPDGPHAARPGSDRSRSDRPRSDRPRSDRSRSDRPGSDRPRSGRPRPDRDPLENRPQEVERGFLTKLHWGEKPHGFVSPDKAGLEVRFEPAVVHGLERFEKLMLGDYVEFAFDPATVGSLAPMAVYVRKIEREVRTPRTNLARHPKARGRKPTWR